MSQKTSLILLVVLILGIVILGFFVLKKDNMESTKTKVVPLPMVPGNVIKPVNPK